jgi:hypothetical protein
MVLICEKPPQEAGRKPSSALLLRSMYCRRVSLDQAGGRPPVKLLPARLMATREGTYWRDSGSGPDRSE